jgi:hypothetical protein
MRHCALGPNWDVERAGRNLDNHPRHKALLVEVMNQNLTVAEFNHHPRACDDSFDSVYFGGGVDGLACFSAFLVRYSLCQDSSTTFP